MARTPAAIEPSAPPVAISANTRRASPMVNCAPMKVQICTSIKVLPTPTEV